MHARFPWTAPISDAAPEVALLLPEHVRGLRLPWLSRFSVETLQAHLRAYPGMSLYVARTGEYVIVEKWRRRDDITHIMEAHAKRGKGALIEATLDRARDRGYRLVVMSDDVWNGSPKLYGELGFAHIERIVFFQKDLRGFNAGELAASLPQIEVVEAGWRDLDLLLALDHDSFPWLWWNSPAEFEEYMGVPGVRVFLAQYGEELVGYTSFTMYNGWAHLDRIAVVSSKHGRKLGAAQLAYALGAMRNLGAASVALSTQQSNTQSHALYNRFGFRLTREQMNFYGARLASDE